MTNTEANAKAQAIADLVKDAAASGQNPTDLQGLVFVNVKTLILELAPVTPDSV